MEPFSMTTTSTAPWIPDLLNLDSYQNQFGLYGNDLFLAYQLATGGAQPTPETLSMFNELYAWHRLDFNALVNAHWGAIPQDVRLQSMAQTGFGVTLDTEGLQSVKDWLASYQISEPWMELMMVARQSPPLFQNDLATFRSLFDAVGYRLSNDGWAHLLSLSPLPSLDDTTIQEALGSAFRLLPSPSKAPGIEGRVHMDFDKGLLGVSVTSSSAFGFSEQGLQIEQGVLKAGTVSEIAPAVWDTDMAAWVTPLLGHSEARLVVSEKAPLGTAMNAPSVMAGETPVETFASAFLFSRTSLDTSVADGQLTLMSTALQPAVGFSITLPGAQAREEMELEDGIVVSLPLIQEGAITPLITMDNLAAQDTVILHGFPFEKGFSLKENLSSVSTFTSLLPEGVMTPMTVTGGVYFVNEWADLDRDSLRIREVDGHGEGWTYVARLTSSSLEIKAYSQKTVDHRITEDELVLVAQLSGEGLTPLTLLAA
jgi:hypothetical protein